MCRSSARRARLRPCIESAETMNHHAAFFNTAADNPPKILHLQMRPLTLGHVYLLHCVESPFVLLNKELGEQDLFLAALICSDDWRKGKGNIDARFFPSFLRLWSWNTRRRDRVSHLARFDEYIATGMKSAEQKISLESGEDLQSPWLWRLIAFLMCEAGMSFEASLDMKCWQANAIYVARAEMKHGLKLISERDHDLWEFARREDEKLGIGGLN